MQAYGKTCKNSLAQHANVWPFNTHPIYLSFYAKFQSFFGVQLGHTIPPFYCSIINHRYHKQLVIFTTALLMDVMEDVAWLSG